MKKSILYMLVFSIMVTGCQDDKKSNAQESKLEIAPIKENATTVNTTPNESAPKTAMQEAIEFPAIPQITIPNFIGTSQLQTLVESKLSPIIDPAMGVVVRPASCQGDAEFFDGAMIVSSDENGYQQVSDGVAININADGSAEGVGAGVVFSVAQDGSGSVTSTQGSLTVNTDGSGEWAGGGQTVSLDGKGAGTWTGASGTIVNNGNGSGEWVGVRGVMTNNGDGTGEIAGRGKVAMTPLPPLPPAGKFALLNRLQKPKNPCGFVISLSDQVLFDFDKFDLRPEGQAVMDTLAQALVGIEAQQLKIGGHTDAKGSDDYNQTLSERRANGVADALKTRQVSIPMSAIGYGETRPIAPNEIHGKDNPQGRQLNRRVEIFVKTS